MSEAFVNYGEINVLLISRIRRLPHWLKTLINLVLYQITTKGVLERYQITE